MYPCIVLDLPYAHFSILVFRLVVFHSKGVRLDIYVESEDGTSYDVEVQTTDKRNLPKRMRFYQSIMDINFLNKGMDYNVLCSG